MPKRARLSDNPLTPSREREPDMDKVRPVGVTLAGSEIAKLDKLADDLGVSRNHLMRYLIRYGVRELEAGRLEPETTKKVQVQLALPES